MTLSLKPTPAAARFFGWHVVAAAFVLAVFGWGVGFYGPPIYLQAVRAARGWSLPLVSAAVTVHFLCGPLVIANLPGLYRRFGIAAVTRAGSICLALGVLGWAEATAPGQLFAATVFSGCGWVTMAAAAINAVVSRWFSRRRAAALAMAYNGASIGGVVFSPLWSLLIGGVGFPAAAIWVGVAMVLVVWLLAGRYFAVTPEQVGQGVDGVAAVGVSGPGSGSGSGPEPEPALPRTVLRRDRRFLTLAAGMALALFAQIGLLAHLYSLLVPVIGAKGAGFAMAGATAMAIAGRTTVGWLPPVGADRRLAACASLLVQIGGSLVLMLAGGSAAG